MSHFPLVRYQVEKDIPEYLQPGEARQIINAAAGNRQGARDQLFLDLLLQTGIRISEALRITPGDLTWLDRQPVLWIRLGKGGKTRQVSLPARIAAELLEYQRQRQLGSRDRFFSITRQRAWQIIKTAAGAAGISKNSYPHLFRHSYAIEFLRQTGHPAALQKLLGHTTPAMTLRYLRLLQVEDALKIAEGVEI
ncbi:tyrosine-type recombinase/integrase [Chloroflexota bacterium]